MSDTPRKSLRCTAPGDMTSTNIIAYKTVIERSVESVGAGGADWEVLELDLRHVRFVDSVGVNLIVHAVRLLRAKSKGMRILTSSKNLLRVLSFTKLNEFAEVVFEEPTQTP